MAVKSTIFELQQSFLHIFGVAQNFWFNGGGFMSQKGGATAPPPVSGPVTSMQNLESVAQKMAELLH